MVLSNYSLLVSGWASHLIDVQDCCVSCFFSWYLCIEFVSQLCCADRFDSVKTRCFFPSKMDPVLYGFLLDLCVSLEVSLKFHEC